MRLLFYILFFAFLFLGCAAKKKTDKSMVAYSESFIDENIDSKKKTLSSWNDLFSFSESENIVINIKRYDTTAKPDSVGMYPLKEEQTISSTRNTEAKQTLTGEQKEKAQQTKKKRTQEKSKSNERLKTGYSVDVAGGNNIVWLWVFFSVIGILVLYFLIKKLIKL